MLCTKSGRRDRERCVDIRDRCSLLGILTAFRCFHIMYIVVQLAFDLPPFVSIDDISTSSTCNCQLLVSFLFLSWPRPARSACPSRVTKQICSQKRQDAAPEGVKGPARMTLSSPPRRSGNDLCCGKPANFRPRVSIWIILALGLIQPRQPSPTITMRLERNSSVATLTYQFEARNLGKAPRMMSMGRLCWWVNLPPGPTFGGFLNFDIAMNSQAQITILSISSLLCQIRFEAHNQVNYLKCWLLSRAWANPSTYRPAQVHFHTGAQARISLDGVPCNNMALFRSELDSATF